MIRRMRMANGAVALLVLACGCSRAELGLLNSLGQSAPKTPQEVFDAQGCKVDVTEAEAVAFADKLIAAIHEGRTRELNAMVDYDVLARIAVRGVSNAKSADEFRKRFLDGLNPSQAGLFESALREKAKVRRVRITNNARGRHVLLRIIPESGGLSYFELALVRSKTGDPVAVDAFLHTIGENFTDTLRRLYLLSGGDDSQWLDVKTSEAELQRALRAMKSMTENMNRGDFRAVLNEYQSLPEAFKCERLYLQANMRAALNVSDEEYRRAMGEIRKYHGDAAWADLLLLDDDFMAKNFDSAFARIDRLERAVGPDPYLHVLRAGIFGEMEKYPEALAAVERGIRAEPTLIDGHQVALNMGALTKRFDVVRRELLVLENDFGKDVDELAALEGFAEFRESDEYPRWQSARSAK